MKADKYYIGFLLKSAHRKQPTKMFWEIADFKMTENYEFSWQASK